MLDSSSFLGLAQSVCLASKMFPIKLGNGRYFDLQKCEKSSR